MVSYIDHFTYVMKLITIAFSIMSLTIITSCCQKKEDAASWAGKLLKDKGIEVPFHPSVNFVELQRQYKANPDLWEAAFDCLAKKAPEIHDITDFGITELVGKKCYVNIAELNPRPFEETKLEGHKDYADIQLTEGPVRWGICSKDSDKLKVLSEYDPDQDAAFYLSDDTVYYDQPADQPSIFVFFPKDLHNPSFAAEGVVYEKPLKKIVLKVACAD